MEEATIKLRDLRRAVQDYRTWKNRLESCEWKSWDGNMAGFRHFLNTTPVVGEQLNALSRENVDETKMFVPTEGGWERYSPPANETERLAAILKLVFKCNADQLMGTGLGISQESYLDAGFNYIRTNILSELFDTVETKLERKLEDLQDEYHEDTALIPISLTYIFGTHIAVATGSGSATVIVNPIFEMGVDLLLRRITELQTIVLQIKGEQDRVAVVADNNDRIINEKLGEIKNAVHAGETRKAQGLWQEFLKNDLNVSKLSEAAGNIVDVTTLAFLIISIANGASPISGT